MKEKKFTTKNFIQIFFIVSFMLVILVPFLMLDTTEIIDSTLENRRMTMWPGWHFNQEMNAWYGHYVEDRVGFREEVVQGYMDGVYRVFGEFSTRMHMFAKDGEVFPANEEYIKAYQHLATDEQLIDSLVIYLDNTNQYLKSQGIPFYFMAGLDKKTVYPECMPDSIHVDESKESIMGMLSGKLSEKEIPYVIPIKELSEAKNQERVYNRIYDSTHWNANGTLLGLTLLDEQIRKDIPDLPPLQKEDFDLSYETKRIEFISLPIMDEIPLLTLKKELAASVREETDLVENLNHMPGTTMRHFVNDNAPGDTKILLFIDSFLQDNAQYFSYRYHDVYLISRQNYERLQEYVEILKPDVVVFENAERAFVDDLYAYVNLRNVSYD